MMQADTKLGLLSVLEGSHIEFRCGTACDGAINAGRDEHGIVGDGAVHAVGGKIGSWRFRLQVILR